MRQRTIIAYATIKSTLTNYGALKNVQLAKLTQRPPVQPEGLVVKLALRIPEKLLLPHTVEIEVEETDKEATATAEVQPAETEEQEGEEDHA